MTNAAWRDDAFGDGAATGGGGGGKATRGSREPPGGGKAFAEKRQTRIREERCKRDGATSVDGHESESGSPSLQSRVRTRLESRGGRYRRSIGRLLA